MSGFSTPLGGATSSQPKQISNRLLNMKFMQRAAASSTQNTPTTPSARTGEPHPKRRRTGDFSITTNNLNSPATPISSSVNTPSHGDRAALSGTFSVAANSLPIRKGTNNFGAPGEETEWVLDVRLPVANGIANGANGNYDEDENDSEDVSEYDGVWSPTAPRGRQTYGSFKKKRSAAPKPVVATPTPSTNKRSHPDNDDDDGEGDLSPLPSSAASDDLSEGEVDDRHSQTRPKKKGTFDFASEEDLKKMDAMDFQKAGFNHGFGRQRYGLGGAGGGGGGGAMGTPGHGRGQVNRNNKKVRKTM